MIKCTQPWKRNPLCRSNQITFNYYTNSNLWQKRSPMKLKNIWLLNLKIIYRIPFDFYGRIQTINLRPSTSTHYHKIFQTYQAIFQRRLAPFIHPIELYFTSFNQQHHITNITRCYTSLWNFWIIDLLFCFNHFHNIIIIYIFFPS
jgi:hypothetical protein